MDKLKHFIEQNREAFDSEVLPEGHFERFEQRLPAAPPAVARRFTLWLVGTAAIAASLALLLVLGNPQRGEGGSPTTAPTAQNCPEGELEELHTYYAMQMYDLMERMAQLSTPANHPGLAELTEAARQLLSDTHQFEQTVLPTLPCNNNGLYAMTQHYNNSLEGLSFMLKQMEQVSGQLTQPEPKSNGN